MNAPADKRPGGGEPDAGQDGSMEDILASIRRILAEDQAAPMLGSPEAEKPGEEVLDLTEQMLASEPAARSQEKGQEKGASQDMTSPEAAKPDSKAGMSAADIDALFAASKAPAPTQKPAEAMSAADIDAMFDAPVQATPVQAAPAQAGPASQPAPPAEASSPPPAPAAPAASAAAEAALLGGSTAASAAASFAALRAAARGPGDEARPAVPDLLLGNGAVTLEQIVRDELRPLLKAWLDANLPPLVERLVKAELERVARG